jgi:hypothetical protein
MIDNIREDLYFEGNEKECNKIDLHRGLFSLV